MGTLKKLKRDLKRGDELICLFHWRSDLKEDKQKRVIARKEYDKVIFENGGSLDYPVSDKQVFYEDNTFSFFTSGIKTYIEEDEVGHFYEIDRITSSLRGRLLCTFKIIKKQNKEQK